MRDEKHFSARKRASVASALQRGAKLSKKAASLFGQPIKGDGYAAISFYTLGIKGPVESSYGRQKVGIPSAAGIIAFLIFMIFSP